MIKTRILTFFLLCFLSLSQMAFAQEALPPNTTVLKFYKWYITAMSKDEPLSNSRPKMKSFVSSALLKEIDQNPDISEDADYFIKAQDVPENWLNSLKIEKTETDGPKATVVVVIGATQETYRHLTVSLNKEGKSWKIRKVKDDRDQFPPPKNLPLSDLPQPNKN
jgi:hypothetical protein